MRGKRSACIFRSACCGITPAGAGKTRKFPAHTVQVEDHPRRCGENLASMRKKLIALGSPPQVRGKQKPNSEILFYNRITPAGAGKTISMRDMPSYLRDHPRRCGENISLNADSNENPGSPPQVRGKRFIPNRADIIHGITPAGAGKTKKKQR